MLPISSPEQQPEPFRAPALRCWVAPSARVVLSRLRSIRRQEIEPPSPRSLLPAVPEDLDALCMALLRVDPKARPTARQVLERLGQRELILDALPGDAAVPFIGRQPELERLRGAFQAARQGHGAAVLIEGESGLGKSALMRRFLESLGEDEGAPLVLSARCCERESVPYKAFDGMMDVLSRYLVTLPEAELDVLLPPAVGLLARAFPVMSQVRALGRAAPLESEAVAPHELRARLLVALRELLLRLAMRRTVVLALDDLQWADADSLTLLGGLLWPRMPSLLLVATVRLPWERARISEAELRACLGEPVERIRLAGLGETECRQLALLLLKPSDESAASAASVADEAGGHPLFLQELIHFTEHRPLSHGPLRLDDVIAARIEALEPPARELLELVALLGAYARQELIARAAQISFGEYQRRVTALRASRLVRTSGARRTDWIETYHDRVREVALASLSPEARRRWHEKLACAMEVDSDANAEALAIHWQGAGKPAKAAEYAILAADQASAALAFDRAARLYRSALALESPGSLEEVALRIRLASSLASAGRGAEAAETYLQTAKLLPPEQALDCKRLAADHLLRSGRVHAGTELMGKVLEEAGMPMPSSPRRTMLALAGARARLALRGLGYRERPEREIPLATIRRLDLCWSVALDLAMVDPAIGWLYHARNLALALDVGEPRRITRALAMELSWMSMTGTHNSRRARRLAKEVERLAHQVGDPETLGNCWLHLGMMAFGGSLFRQAIALLGNAERIFRDECVGAEYELANARIVCEYARFQHGEWGELARRVPRFVREAILHDDRYAATSFRMGAMIIAWLLEDDVEGARRQLAEAREWPWKELSNQHYQELYARANIDAYAGETEAAFEYAQQATRLFGRTQMMNVLVLQTGLLDLSARAALASAAKAPVPEARLAIAERDARRLLRAKLRGAAGLGDLLLGGVAMMRGDRTAAEQHLRRAVDILRIAEWKMNAAVARWRLGELIGGQEGEALVQAAKAFMTAQRVRNLLAMLRLVSPGFPDPTAPSAASPTENR